MKSIYLVLFWAFFTTLILWGNTVEAAPKIPPPERFFPIYSYHNDWLVYSNQYKNYIPYSQGVDEGSRYISVYVDLIKNRRYSLLLKTDTKNYLFLDGALQKETPADKWVRISVDSLYRIYKRDEVLLTIYGSTGTETKNLLLCNERKKEDLAAIGNTTSNFINIKPITFSPFGNFAGLALIMILILNAWIFNANPLAFIRLINPLELINNDPRDQLSKVNKPYSSSIIFFVVIISMLDGFILLFMSFNKIDMFSVGAILSEKVSTLQLMGDFFILSSIFFLIFYGKYVFMVMAGNMLNLDKIVDVLFIKIVQSSYLFYAAAFLLVFMLTFNHGTWLDFIRPFVLFPFLFFYSARFAVLYLVTKPSGALINLYLFSYLCVIEIIPLIIGIKFAL